MDTELCLVCEHGDFASIKYIIGFGVDINEKGKFGNTPLMLACSRDKLENKLQIIKYLIERGANPLEKNNRGNDCFDDLFEYVKNFEIIKYLIESVSDLNEKNKIIDRGLRLIFMDLSTDSQEYNLADIFEFVKYSIESRESLVNRKDPESGRTPLMDACYSKCLNLVEYLINRGANINEKDINGFTPLIDICFECGRKGRKLSKFYLTSHGLEASDEACENMNLQIVKLLVEHGADVNPVNVWGMCPILYACKEHNFKIVKYLLEKEQSLANIKDPDGRTVLMYACESMDLDLVKYIYSLGEVSKTISDKDANGTTALMYAYKGGSLDIVKFLTDLEGAGAIVNPHDKDNKGKSALMYACMGGNLEIVKLIVEMGGKINVQMDGHIALYFCTDNFEVTKYLVENGADVNMKLGNGWLPLFQAYRDGNIEIVKLLLNHGANVHEVDINQLTDCNIINYIEFHKFLLSIFYVSNYFNKTSSKLTATLRKHLINFISDWKIYTTEEDNDLYNQYLKFICKNLFSIDVKYKTHKEIYDIISDKLQEYSEKIRNMDYSLFKDVDPVSQEEFTEFDRMDLYQYGEPLEGKYRGITEDYINQCLDKTIIEDPLDRMDLMSKKSNVVNGNVFMDYLIRKMIKSAII